jgi:hypothetical protein
MGNTIVQHKNPARIHRFFVVITTSHQMKGRPGRFATGGGAQQRVTTPFSRNSPRTNVRGVAVRR